MSTYDVSAFNEAGFLGFTQGSGLKGDVLEFAATLVEWFAGKEGWTGGTIQMTFGRKKVAANVSTLDDVAKFVASLGVHYGGHLPKSVGAKSCGSPRKPVESSRQQATGQPGWETGTDAAMITSTSTDTDKGEKANMAANTAQATDYAAIVEEVIANIERAKSLAEAENVEALEELHAETETMISRLPARGKTEDGKSWTAAKKEFRDSFRAAATVQEKPAAKKEVVKKEEAPVKTFDQYEGVPELITMGADKAAESVRLHIKTSTTAKELATIGLDMWKRIPNKDNNPDIMGDSDQAKAASKALKQAAGAALGADGKLDAYDVDVAVKKLWRSVQAQRTDVRAEYLRGLDADTDEAKTERERFARLLKDRPEDTPASVWLADKYGVSLKGESEKARERYYRALAAANGGDGPAELEEAQTPDEHVSSIVGRVMKDIKNAKPELFEQASEETKKAVDEKLEEAIKALREMRAALL